MISHTISAFGNGLARQAERVEKHCREAILSLLERDPNARLLDLGCADGTFTMAAATKIGTGRVSGVDAVAEVVEEAKVRGVDAYVSDLDKGLPFDDESFEIVCASHVIEHVCNTDLFVSETYRVLRQGGYLVIATPNLAAAHSILLLMLGRQPTIAEVSDVALVGTISPRGSSVARVGPAHRRVFTFPSLTGLLSFYGYHVEKSVGAGYFPLPTFLAKAVCIIDRLHSSNVVIKARKP